MPTINQLSAVDQVQASDQVPVYSNQNGDARKASLSVLAAFIRSLVTFSDDKVTQYANPNASGSTITVPDGSQSVWLVVTPAAAYSSMTIKLPAVDGAVDKQEVLVNCTQSVTSLSVNGNGATVVGAPTTLVTNGFFRLRFEAVLKTWYRVG